MHDVRLYFDFISPYSYLAWMRTPEFAERHRVRFEPIPVVYAALLDTHHLVGPGEVDVKRQYTFLDVLRTARTRGVPLQSVPAHPFRSIEALRTVCAFRASAKWPELITRIFAAGWGRGEDLTDLDVLAAAVDEPGLDGARLSELISAPAVKAALRAQTEEALAKGVFGVPTFEYEGELFWGDDRMDALAARLDGEPAFPRELLQEVLARPKGTTRRGAP